MKIKYYPKYFSFMLPIYIICFFLGACSKLGDRYNYDDDVVDMECDAVYDSSSKMNFKTEQSNWIERLFSAIEKGNKDRVEVLLNNISEEPFIEENRDRSERKMDTCLHIAAGVTNPNAEKIIDLLIGKFGNSLIKNYDKPESPLLFKNTAGETPLLMAMKKGNQEVLKSFLKNTNIHAGLNN